ncbi:OLC1v1019994C1 [Oldenlandia corymbosa var. corymbosa]|uniref:OLC1v1019994C1 n=1 Tax=Oldenlandia corymbosa var. corymbosa TaxID=529605 RepID=A0AAV1EFK5_OLDCO|nr:OLC1v1019994C1 [Oldenlandia corymbosa var. corymbosa]
MAATTMSLMLALVLATIFSMLSGVPSQVTPECDSVLHTLAPCVDFVTGNSSKPTETCCNEFHLAVQTNLTCICQALNDPDIGPRYGINGTIALTLPDQCNQNEGSSPIGDCNLDFHSGSSKYRLP